MRLSLYLLIAFGVVHSHSVSVRYILNALAGELHYEAILLVESSRESESCWKHKDVQGAVPILSFNGNQSLYLKDDFSTNILALVCLDGSEGSNMQALYQNLEDMRDTPTILFVPSDSELQDVFLECLRRKMLNVLAFKGSDWGFVYSFRAFPEFRVIERNVRDVLQYFEPQLEDLGGHTLSTLPDNIIPRTAVYRSPDGSRQLAGYLYPFVRNYVSTINATLKICWHLVPEDGMTQLGEVVRLSEIHDVDLPLGIHGIEHGTTSQNVPLEISSWFLMLPMEPCLPRAKLFVMLGFEKLAPVLLLLTILLGNAHRIESGLGPSWRCYILVDRVLRGALAQPFFLPRRLSVRLMLVYFVILLNGFTFSNCALTILETWLVHPPPGHPIRSWEQLRTLKLKVLTIPADLDTITKALGKQFAQRNSDLFELSDAVNFQNRRLAMDQSYAYPVTGTLWPLLKHVQTRLRQPAFRRSRELVLIPLLILAMPLPKNSMFHKSLNRYRGLTQQSGLYQYWSRRSFGELAALRKIHYKVKGGQQTYRDFEWQDFGYVWLGFVAGAAVSVLVLLGEIGYHSWQLGRN
ncbi:uncharacterized protein LOC26526229 [Drosophila erecta]|uniref:Ionotropic glutamate receptor C-terminal domain-containing protein n=1 Tax=Drosophila erecta TaxID=7220 RepID=A0A0Q5VQF7_DROER|nr:uncharacterized protein LOC26526229 [Drosophila erecta]KQS63124.1 uncharacterized protein Dere_GG26405 [Drosophila erecta]